MANDYIVINDDLRTMQIPSSITILGVESDDDVNKIPFQMPKEYCGFDLSTFEARINYMNANGVGDIYIVEDLAVDGDDPSLMNFTWLVGRNACAYKGNTQFIVCLKKFDNDDNVVQEFNTTVYSLPVLQGLETTEAVIQENADIIEQILNMLEDAGGVDLSNYYNKAEVNALKLANPEPLIINGTSYDGSEEVELTIEGSSNVLSSANGQIIHLTDAVPNVPLESMTLYDSNDSVITSASIAVANKNLFRNDLIAQQTVSKGITFEKNSNGAIHATGTSTGTYASAQCTLDPAMFVVGQTYTISSGKSTGILYVQLILNYSDGTTDYLVSSNTPYTFTLAKPVTSATGCVQITASGVTVDDWIYPMIELDDHASAFVDNIYSAMTYDGSTLPVMPSSICNIWSNDSTVANIAIEYREDPVLGQLNAMQEQIDTITEHDDQLSTTSEHAVKNKVVTAALAQKITKPSLGINGQILTKYNDEAVWSNAGLPTDEQVVDAVTDWLDGHPEATTTVQDGSITTEKLATATVAQMNSNKLTTAIKNAFMTLFEHVAYIDGDGQTYLDALEAAFDERTVLSIDAVFTQGSATIYTTDDLDDLKQYLVVTAYYDDGSTGNVTVLCELSGTLTEGTSTITATYGGKTDTFDVTVSEAPTLPEGYTAVEYIQATNATNAAYNTLNVTLTSSDSVEVRLGMMATGTQSSASGGYPVVCKQSSSGNTIGYGVLVDQSVTKISSWDGTLCSIEPNGGSSILNTKYDIVATKTPTGMSITDGTHSNSITTTPRSTYGSLYVFSMVSSVPFKGRIYYMDIYVNNVLASSLHPCKRISDNVAGFYDTVQERFMTDDKYSAGPVI